MEEYKSIKDMTLEECRAMRDEHLVELYDEDEEYRKEREMFGPFEDNTDSNSLLDMTNEDMPVW